MKAVTPLALSACAVAGLLLAGCGTLSPSGSTLTPAPTASAPAPEQPASMPVRGTSGASVSKSLVEGTELICLTTGSYGSTSCNWELWNKTREAK